MSVEEVKIIYNYFNNKIGRAKVGMYVSEMRRQISVMLSKDGANPAHIAKIINSDRATVYHYVKYCSPPTKKVEEAVKEGMMKWINEGLIPKRFTSNNISKLALVDNINVRPSVKRAAKKPVRYDNILSEIKKELDIKI
jgi:hypothetical protein